MCYFIRINSFLPTYSNLLLSLCLLTAVSTQAATYNTETRELTLPSLINGSTTLTDVTIKLNPDGTYHIQDGIEPTLPFLCPGKFDQTTIDLVKNASNISQVDSLLACNWSIRTANVNRPTTSVVGSTWYDSVCSSLLVIISEVSGEVSTFVTLQENKISCNINNEFSPNFYNFQSKAFFINSVIIDNITLATEVILKFNNSNQYELTHITFPEQVGLPIICRTLTTNDFNAISSDMSPDEINKILNCHWKSTRISESGNLPYSWVDHECNEVSIVRGESKGFIQTKNAGCGAFVAH